MLPLLVVTGNLGQDPVLQQTPQGKSYVRIGVAVNFKAGGEEKTNWYNITFWDRKAEVAAQYLKKGTNIVVYGRVTQNEYTDKTGTKVRDFAISGIDFEMGARANNANAATANGTSVNAANTSNTVSTNPQSFSSQIDEDDIPF